MLRDSLKLVYRRFYEKFHYDTFKTLVNLGKIQATDNALKNNISSLGEVEFQVFSQRGEDGILQYIISKLEIPNKVFIEFGVETYTESNTRFLLINNNWSGLVIDGDKKNIEFIQNDFIYWKYDITACHSFITKDNINGLIRNFTPLEDIGLLSVDIDGNDYWVWEAIETVKPRIVVCEYNSAFGPSHKVSIPYSANFQRTKAHYSNLYFGASLSAFHSLAEKKGYDFIGAAEPGVNAFFVRKDLSAPFKKYSAEQGFRPSHNRDSKDEKGKLTFLRHEHRLPLIKDMSVVDVISGKTHLIKDLYNLKS